MLNRKSESKIQKSNAQDEIINKLKKQIEELEKTKKEKKEKITESPNFKEKIVTEDEKEEESSKINQKNTEKPKIEKKILKNQEKKEERLISYLPPSKLGIIDQRKVKQMHKIFFYFFFKYF